MSIGLKFFICVAAMLLTISSFVYYYYPKKYEEYSLGMLENKVKSMAEMVALGIGVGRDLNNFSVINNALNWAKRDDNLAYIILVDGNNETYATYDPKHLALPTDKKWEKGEIVEQDGLLIIEVPVNYNDSDFGRLIIGYTLDELYANISNHRSTSLMVSFIIMFVGAGLSLFISQRITRPLKQLTEVAGEAARGNYNARVKINTFDEVGKLGLVFQLMLRKIRNAMAEITKHSSDLEEKNQELVAFTRGASHDLQEPLRKIITFVDRVKNNLDEETNEKNLDFLRRVEKASERMQGLIDSLLKYSKIDFESENFNDLDLEEIVSEVTSDLEIQIEESGAKVEVSGLPKIHGNRTGIKQLFQNLISNSIKYARKGIAPNISISGKTQHDGFLEIRIQDNGIGFDPKYLGKIFQPFQRLHSSKEYSGNGIGLAICQKVVRQHNGAITAEGALDKGATFIITFPSLAVINKTP